MNRIAEKYRISALFMSHAKANHMTVTVADDRCAVHIHKLLKQARVHNETGEHQLTQFNFSPCLLTRFKSQYLPCPQLFGSS